MNSVKEFFANPIYRHIVQYALHALIVMIIAVIVTGVRKRSKQLKSRDGISDISDSLELNYPVSYFVVSLICSGFFASVPLILCKDPQNASNLVIIFPAVALFCLAGCGHALLSRCLINYEGIYIPWAANLPKLQGSMFIRWQELSLVDYNPSRHVVIFKTNETSVRIYSYLLHSRRCADLIANYASKSLSSAMKSYIMRVKNGEPDHIRYY